MGFSGHPPGRARRLLRLAVSIATADWPTLRQLRRTAPTGEPDRAWRETVLQTHLFCGFPRVVEALALLAEEGGLGPAEDDEQLEPEAYAERGLELFRRVYADQAEAVRGALEERGGVWARWVLEQAYGRVLSRPGLDAAARETLAVACLTALGPERQLAGHVRGALRCGATRAELAEALDHVADLADAGHVEHARRLIERIAT